MAQVSKTAPPNRILLGITVLVPTVLVLANVPGFGGSDDSTDGEKPISPVVAAVADEFEASPDPSMLDPSEETSLSEANLVPTPEPVARVDDELVIDVGETSIPDPTVDSSTTSTTVRQTSSTQPSTSTTAPPQTTTTSPASTSSLAQQQAHGPITISGEDGVTLENLSISNPGGVCVRVVNSSNVTIKDSTIGPCGDWGVFIDRSSGVTVEGSTIRTGSSKGGVYGHSSSGVAVVGNSVSGSGRNPVQFDKVTGAGNRIDNNSISSSAAEDMISVYMSGGTSGSWMTVRGNTVRDNTGQSHSGSGIMVGDAGGSHIVVQGNSLTDPGQAGIGVAGGSNIRVVDNTVRSGQFSWSNVGIYVWDQYNSNCHSVEVRGNTVDWVNSSGQSNPAWDGGGCGSVAGWGNNSW